MYTGRFNATAAGVLVTADIFERKQELTFTINAKSGLGIRVVEGKKLAEQILLDLGRLSMKVISRSDETTMLVFDKDGGVKEVPTPKGKPILTEERAMDLSLAARAMANVFKWKEPLDVEWLYEGDTLYIVQVRPYLGL